MDKTILSTQDHFISCPPLQTVDLSKNNYFFNSQTLSVNKSFFTDLFKHLRHLIDKEAAYQASLAKKKVTDQNNVCNIILEILLARKYRSGKREQTDPLTIYKKIESFCQKNEPLELYISMFPCKIPNPLKSAGSMPDLAEVISLSRLIEICTAIEKVYPPGAKFTILPDGKRFLKIANFPLQRILSYQLQLLQLIYDLGGTKKIHCLDYVELLARLKHSEKQKMVALREEFFKEFSSMFGTLSDQLSYQKIINHIQQKEDYYKNNELGRKFFSLFRSLLYTVYHPEVMEGTGNNNDTQAVKIYTNILSFSSDAQINKIRRKIVLRTWNGAIAYITNISIIRVTAPSEKIFPKAIRFDMHNIPGRIGLYTAYRSTKYTPFHTSGFIDEKGKMRIDFRINLENKSYIKISADSYNKNYGTQPFMYVHKDFVSLIKTNPTHFIHSLSFKQ